MWVRKASSNTIYIHTAQSKLRFVSFLICITIFHCSLLLLPSILALWYRETRAYGVVLTFASRQKYAFTPFAPLGYISIHTIQIIPFSVLHSCSLACPAFFYNAGFFFSSSLFSLLSPPRIHSTLIYYALYFIYLRLYALYVWKAQPLQLYINSSSRGLYIHIYSLERF